MMKYVRILSMDVSNILVQGQHSLITWCNTHTNRAKEKSCLLQNYPFATTEVVFFDFFQWKCRKNLLSPSSIWTLSCFSNFQLLDIGHSVTCSSELSMFHVYFTLHKLNMTVSNYLVILRSLPLLHYFMIL